MSTSSHIVCPVCNAINRIAALRLEDKPKCGKCHTRLFTATPMELTTANFQKHISRNDIPVLVDFWAPWCGPCKMMGPAFEQAAKQLEPTIRLAKLNTESEQAIGTQYGIRSIPTIALFKNGEEIARQAGAMGASDIVRWVKGQL
jgi:thioredoxin 2